MSELEKFIRENREDFDYPEPAHGHGHRFSMRLEKEGNQRKEAIIFWRVAAAIIILVAIGGALFFPRLNGPDDVQYASMSLGDVSSELADVEKYYSSQLASEYHELEGLSRSNPEVASLFNELELLNNDYRELEKMLYESGSHEKVITAMIENFRLRLSIMEKLEEIKQQTKRDSL